MDTKEIIKELVNRRDEIVGKMMSACYNAWVDGKTRWYVYAVEYCGKLCVMSKEASGKEPNPPVEEDETLIGVIRTYCFSWYDRLFADSNRRDETYKYIERVLDASERDALYSALNDPTVNAREWCVENIPWAIDEAIDAMWEDYVKGAFEDDARKKIDKFITRLEGE